MNKLSWQLQSRARDDEGQWQTDIAPLGSIGYPQIKKEFWLEIVLRIIIE